MFPYEPISSVWMVSIAFISLMFFALIDTIIKSLTKLENGKSSITWLQHNTLISFIHSSISSILIITAVLRAPEIHKDPLSHSNFFNYSLLSFSLGYFIWDFYDCMTNSNSSILGILFHHFIAISFLLVALVPTRNLGYTIYALSLEINSVFLHGRRLLRWFSLPSSHEFVSLFVDLCNYITFVLFRFGVIVHGLFMLYIQRNRLGPIVHVFTVLSVAAIGVLNVVLFFRLLNSQTKTRKYKVDDEIISIHNHDIILPS